MAVFVRTRRLGRSPVKGAEVRQRAERMLAATGHADAELSVLLCDDETIHELNRRYRGIDRPTDVLAFAMQEGMQQGKGGPPNAPLLGDVVISIPTSRRQAQEQGHRIIDEVTALLAHGLLHLLGHDHRTRAEERRMNALADGLRAAAAHRSDPSRRPL